MTSTRSVGAIATAAMVLAGILAVPAMARASGPYMIDAHVDGVTGGGDYTPGSFQWNAETFRVTFVHPTDTSTVSLLQLAQSHQVVGTATVHETLQGTAAITLQMSGVRVESVHEAGDINDSNGPEETVVLSFTEVVYTFQPLLPNGQKNGPPVTSTLKR